MGANEVYPPARPGTSEKRGRDVEHCLAHVAGISLSRTLTSLFAYFQELCLGILDAPFALQCKVGPP